MADLGEGQSGALGEEREYLALQCSIRGEEIKVLEYLADSNLLMCLWGNCTRYCPFVFIPLNT
jgi:hypothetical protein